MARNSKVGAYVPKKIVVKLPEEEKNNAQPEPEAAAPEDEEVIAKLTAQLEAARSNFSQAKAEFSPAEFEKDDDTNFHI